MFGFLKRWAWRNRLGIFQFFDGTRTRRVDPMAVQRALFNHPRFAWDTHPVLIDVDDPKVSLEALEITADAVRTAFELPGIEAGGLTETECVNLLASFVAYLNDLKKSTGTTPNSPAVTEPKPSETSPTNAKSASGSMPTASSTAVPSAC